jgi:hypothetical protein
MLDKDDEEAEEEGVATATSPAKKPNSLVTPSKKDEYIDEDKMLDIAEKCFMRIAEAILGYATTVREAFKKHITKDESGSSGDDYLSPQGFLEGVKALGISDLSQLDVACLMRILTKPDLDNAILLQELIIIMENFGIQEGGA